MWTTLQSIKWNQRNRMKKSDVLNPLSIIENNKNHKCA